jgi:hypothetical protein
LKRAIDEGLAVGPRIYPSGAFISQTSGHGDFRMPYEVPRDIAAPLSHGERMGGAAIADGADQVLLRTREQLMQGASQIKLMAGGGVASNYDPLDVTEYSEAEIHAESAQPKTGEPMSRSMPTPHAPSSAPSRQASSASNTASSPTRQPRRSSPTKASGGASSPSSTTRTPAPPPKVHRIARSNSS